VCAVGPGDPISLEVCEHHTLPRGEQECFRITVDKRCARPTHRRIADGLEARLVRAFVRAARCLAVGRRSHAFGFVGRVVADEVGMADGIEDLVIVVPYADVTDIQVGAHAAHASRSMGRVCPERTDDMGRGAYVGRYVSACTHPFTHARRPVRG
jgi:hypothetical protein